MAMPPTLRWALSRVPLRASEKKRLEREQAEVKAFVPNLERLLLAVDESPNGKFTSYIAGLLAGRRGTPITVLLANGGTGHKEPNGPAQGDMVVKNTVIENAIKSAAESNMAKSKAEARAPIEVILRKTPATTSEEAVTTEAKKGYDLLFIGKDKMQTATGAFSSEIDSIASAFEGPLALVIAQGEQLDEPVSKPFDMLVPITGTDVSRRAAELAFSLSKKGNVMALYVGQARRGKAANRRDDRRQAQEILKDIVEFSIPLWLKDRDAHRVRSHSRECNFGGSKKGRIRSYRDGSEPSAWREIVFRQYRRYHSREAALVNFALIDLGLGRPFSLVLPRMSVVGT